MQVKEFMRFDAPEKSIQGMAICGDRVFQLFHRGICAVYDLVTRSPKPLCVFKLGSYNEGTPDDRYTNHANQCMFGRIHYKGNSDLPLLYITTGNSGEADSDGWISRCAVENITVTLESEYSAETVQTIIYNNEGIEETKWQTPGWGWPASFVDTENGFYYIFSARRRTKAGPCGDFATNAYIITKFALPPLGKKGEKVILRPSDILSQFETPFNRMLTQGGTLLDGRIYYLYGTGTPAYPDALNVFDLEAGTLSRAVDLSDCGDISHEEVECCAPWRGLLLSNSQAAKIYVIDTIEDLRKTENEQ